jgi:hypothetical protein
MLPTHRELGQIGQDGLGEDTDIFRSVDLEANLRIRHGLRGFRRDFVRDSKWLLITTLECHNHACKTGKQKSVNQSINQSI